MLLDATDTEVEIVEACPTTATFAVGVPRVTAAVDVLADAGAVASMPRPKAATATSAMRLKVVFVDICFLSISRVREFPALGFG